MNPPEAALQESQRRFWGASRDLDDLLHIPGMRAVIMGASKDPNAKITVLLIPEGDDRPAFAAKAPSTDGAAKAVESERRVLDALALRLSRSHLLAQIPRVVETFTFEGRLGMLVTALPGTPMTSNYLRWRHTARRAAVESDFTAVSTWLTEFQATTAGRRGSLDMDGGVFERLEQRFADETCLSFVLNRLSESLRVLRTAQTPRTAVHGDMWCGNLLVNDGVVAGVVDWEAGAISGEPVRDLVRFAHMYALYLDRHSRVGRAVLGHPGLRAGEWGVGVDYALEGTGWFPQLFRRFLRDGLTRLGAPDNCWRDVAMAGIAEVAATADEEDFARNHLHLFARIAGRR